MRDPIDDKDIDRILLQGLATETPIEPSAKFTTRVMAAVRSEAAMPPPLKFPWPLFLPGPIMLAGVLAWAFRAAFRSTAPPATLPAPLLARILSSLSAIQESAHVYGIDWLLLALGVVWISLKLSAKFSGSHS